MARFIVDGENLAFETEEEAIERAVELGWREKT